MQHTHAASPWMRSPEDPCGRCQIFPKPRKPVTSEHAENNGEMIVALAPGTQRITARFVRTPDRTLGSTISLLGVLTLLALLNAGGVRLLSASP